MKDWGKDFLKKIHWPEELGVSKLVILFLAGVFLLILSLPSGTLSGGSSKKKSDTEKTDTSEEVTESDAAWSALQQYASLQEKKLEATLQEVDGVGKVDVMITLASSEEKVTLQNETESSSTSQETDSSGSSKNDSTQDRQSESVIVDSGDGESPYVVQIQSPKVEGIVVVAQGAGGGTINTEIIQAAQALFLIELHKIIVMKMES